VTPRDTGHCRNLIRFLSKADMAIVVSRRHASMRQKSDLMRDLNSMQLFGIGATGPKSKACLRPSCSNSEGRFGRSS